jgi:hypothetical protein
MLSNQDETARLKVTSRRKLLSVGQINNLVK